MNKQTEKSIEAAKKQVSELESYLSGTLKPIRPPAELVQRLQKRVGILEPNLIAKRLSNWELSIITVGSVMSATMVILTIVRALFYFFGRHKRSVA